VEGEIKNLTSNIQSQFSDLRSLPYRLQSIFIHRGSVSFGHYWIYIYDFTKEIWRKYNDGYVTDVKNREEIFEQEVYNPATPYFLVYVKDEAKDELVEPVCRQLAETLGDLPMEIAPIDGDGGSATAPVSDGDRPLPWGGVHQGTTQSITSWDTRQSYHPDGW
jgi:ubiquitin carboxyl-terminal hydrolase 25/28